jgi:general secretion pathway protein G
MCMEIKYRKGLTLIEIIVVIAIISTLAAIIIPAGNLAREKARITKAKSEVKQIRNAVELLASDSDEWPGHQTVGLVDSGGSGNEVWDLSAGVAGLIATDGSFANWGGPYLPDMPTDPWGNDYFFDTDYDIDDPNGEWTAVIGSFGPNGVGQNVYDADNIIEILASE